MVLQPDFSRVELSAWMAAYFNGEVFPKYRGRDLPVASLDFGGLYVAMHETIGAWELQSAKRIRIYQRNPDDVTRYLKRIARKVNRWLNNPTSRSPLTARDWRRLTRTVAYVKANGDVLPHRVDINPDDRNGPTRMVVGPLYGDVALPFVLADVLRSVLETGSIPEIVSATRLAPWGTQKTTPVTLSENLVLDPATKNPFFQLGEHRIRLGHTRPGDPTLIRTRNLFKGITTAGVGGLPVQILDDEPTSRPRPMHYWDPTRPDQTGPVEGSTRVLETPGRWYDPPVAAGVTAAARLLLYIARTRFERVGAVVVYWDTDSLLVVATPNGGDLIPMAGGSHSMPDGRPAIKTVSFRTVHDVRSQIEVFSPYAEDARPYCWTTDNGYPVKVVLPGFLKWEPENDPPPEAWGLPAPQLLVDIIRSKRYHPFQLVEPGAHVEIEDGASTVVEPTSDEWKNLTEVVMRKPSRHGITFTPLGNHPPGWENQLRADHISERLGLQGLPPEPWVYEPAVSTFPATRPALTKLHPDLEPFDLIGLCTGVLGGSAIAKLHDEPQWIDVETRRPVLIATTTDESNLGGSVPVKSVDLAMRMNARAPEPWALTVDGHPVTLGTRGLLHPAPTKATGIRLIGKEGRRWRDSRNILPGPEVFVYAFRDDGEAFLSFLRSRYSWRGAAAYLADLTGLPIRTIRAVLRGRTPSSRTLNVLRTAGSQTANAGDIPISDWRTLA